MSNTGIYIHYLHMQADNKSQCTVIIIIFRVYAYCTEPMFLINVLDGSFSQTLLHFCTTNERG